MDIIFIFGANYLYLIALIIAAFFFLRLSWQEKKQIVLFGCIALPIMYLILLLVAHFYYDPRPFVVGHFTPLVPHDPDNGFPSDHTLLLSAVASLLYPFNKRGSYLLWLFTIVVGVSRVYVGIHHPIDVIGSMIIALIGSYVGYQILQIMKKRKLINYKEK